MPRLGGLRYPLPVIFLDERIADHQLDRSRWPARYEYEARLPVPYSKAVVLVRQVDPAPLLALLDLHPNVKFLPQLREALALVIAVLLTVELNFPFVTTSLLSARKSFSAKGALVHSRGAHCPKT